METAGGIADRTAAEWASSGLIRERHGTSSDSLFRDHDEPAGRIGLDDGPDGLNSCQDCRDWQVVESQQHDAVTGNATSKHQLAKGLLAPASWCAGSAIKRPCEPVPVTYAPGGHRPDAKRRVHRSAARLPARPRPAPLVATNSSPGVCSVPTPPSRCISPPVCWRSITPPVAVAGSWGCTLAASPGTR